jgi:kynureninase
MAFEFIISQLDSIPSIDGMDKVISVIHYRAQKQYEEDVIHFTADTYGSLGVDAPHEASFTPYDEVTKEMVESWLTASLDCEAIEGNLDAQIQNFLNPPVVAYALPWNQFENI